MELAYLFFCIAMVALAVTLVSFSYRIWKLECQVERSRSELGYSREDYEE